MLVNYILGGLAVLSLLLLLWQWFGASRFPLHQRTLKPDFQPPVTLLKPLKGCDAETKACLESWLKQSYPGPVQILFGVASPEDPVCAIVTELVAEYPGVDAQLIVCSEQLGPNAKVSSLIQMERRAKHDIVIVSDADVRVPGDFLSNTVQPLKNAEVGLVNCFYRFANPSTLAMKWEAIAVNADFWSQVLQSQSLKPIDFALGAVMLTRRDNLKAVGGFEGLVEFLADDYQLGNQIAKTGRSIVISPVVVECWEKPMTWTEVWNHQVRWARTIRVCQPVPFFFSILSNPTLWPVLWSGWMLASGSVPPKFALIPVLLFLPIRIQAALHLQGKLTNGIEHYASFWLVPVKDMLNVAIWGLAFTGNTVQWRGVRYNVLPGGKLQALQD